MTKGFYMDHKSSFGIGINTALYGTFNLETRKIAIRHVIVLV